MDSFVIGYGLFAAVATSAAASGGLGTLWMAVLAANLGLVVLQGGGFYRQSAMVAAAA
ncbi:hypothetical protein [Nonomuraea africana]|uniref:Cytidylate kinase n=1 Tax=Nonomuraea africana TaxID=46171 RepID=A0ABR9KP10_9ACTN|nr:hypothetical protein [Nonomuraea africana]MBE1563755.1 cytidylate kinase [Nonomuraea africana]